MDNTRVSQPKISASSSASHREVDWGAVEIASAKARVYSWPSLHAGEEIEPSPNGLDIRPTSFHSKVSPLPSPDHSSDQTIDEEFCLGEDHDSTHGSLDVFDQAECSTHVATAVSKEGQQPSRPRLLHILPRAQDSLSFSPCSSRSSNLPRSSQLGNASPCLDHRANSNELERLYSLQEALTILFNEAPDARSRTCSDSSGPIYIAPAMDNITANAGGFDRNLEQGDGSHSPFRHQVSVQSPNGNMPHRREEGTSTKRPMRNFMAKLAEPLNFLFSKLLAPENDTSEPKELYEISLPYDPRKVQHMNQGSSSSETTDLHERVPFLRAKIDRDEAEVDCAVPVLRGRLSVTQFFGQTLAEEIEKGILQHSPVNSDGAPTTPVTLPKTRLIRFQEPDRPQRRPQPQIQRPSSPPPGVSARPPRLPPPPPPSPRLEQRPESHLSLRGGCLPTHRSVSPPPVLRATPGHRPGDSIPVPRSLWYLAGGRPLCRDKPGKDCYHGQPKPKNRRRGRHQSPPPERAPNADRCEPLTFGHLRDWKQKVDLRTGLTNTQDCQNRFADHSCRNLHTALVGERWQAEGRSDPHQILGDRESPVMMIWDLKMDLKWERDRINVEELPVRVQIRIRFKTGVFEGYP